MDSYDKEKAQDTIREVMELLIMLYEDQTGEEYEYSVMDAEN